MLEFIVLGKVPGTQIQMDFTLLLIAAGIFIASLALFITVSHMWRRMLDATRSMLTLRQIAL